MLLDDEQQRVLQRSQVPGGSLRSSARLGSLSSQSSSMPPTPTSDIPHRRPEPRTDFTSAGTGAGGYQYGAYGAARGSPRTNFTGRGSPRTNFTGRGSPRTNFTSRGSPRTNFTSRANQNATVNSEGTFKSSDPTVSVAQSPRTNFTTRGANNKNSGEYPSNDSSPGVMNSDEFPSEYAPLQRSNPFVTIEERDSHDPVEAFKGTHATVKVSVTHILIGAMLGLGLGILFATIKVSNVAAEWVALPGDLFLRAVKALVVPYVFCSVAVAIGDIVYVGKVSAIGLQTAKIFLTESFTGTAAGLAIALAFRPLFRAAADSSYSSTASNSVAFICGSGLPLHMHKNGSLVCMSSANSTDATNSTSFVIDDLYNTFAKSTATTADYTITDQLILMLDSIVPENLFSAMSGTSELMSVITFAMVMGAIAGRNYFTRSRRINYLYMVLLQMRNSFFLALEWVIWLTPIAVVSIIAGSFANNQDSVNQFGEVYTYLIASICGMLVQMLLVFPAVMFFFTRCNPYNHMKLMVRSYIFAFGSASSLATAPVTLSCLQKARVCSQSLANFVISLGVVTNFSGAGFYYPIGIVYLAEASGNGDELTSLRILAIFFLTIIACIATPPVPSAGQVVMATMYKTVFATSDLPSSWALYATMDFFADRLSTVCNVNDDIMALKVIAENTDETVAGDQLGIRD